MTLLKYKYVIPTGFIKLTNTQRSTFNKVYLRLTLKMAVSYLDIKTAVTGTML